MSPIAIATTSRRLSEANVPFSLSKLYTGRRAAKKN